MLDLSLPADVSLQSLQFMDYGDDDSRVEITPSAWAVRKVQ